jgi:hypothetical protein
MRRVTGGESGYGRGHRFAAVDFGRAIGGDRCDSDYRGRYQRNRTPQIARGARGGPNSCPQFTWGGGYTAGDGGIVGGAGDCTHPCAKSPGRANSNGGPADRANQPSLAMYDQRPKNIFRCSVRRQSFGSRNRSHQQDGSIAGPVARPLIRTGSKLPARVLLSGRTSRLQRWRTTTRGQLVSGLRRHSNSRAQKTRSCASAA